MSDLFRKEALEHARAQLDGEVMLAAPVGTTVLSIGAVAVVAAFMVFLATGSYARKEAVEGWLTPDLGLVRVVAPSGGTVEAVPVREGTNLAPGTSIAQIRVTSTVAAGDVYQAVDATYEAQLLAAVQRADAAKDALDAERAELSGRLQQLDLEIQEGLGRIPLQDQRVAIANQDAERAEAIAAEGYLTRQQLDARKLSALQEQQRLSELRSAILALRRQRGEVSARLMALPIALRDAEAAAAETRAGLERQRTETDSRSSYMVSSSIGGRVSALPVRRGQTLAPGATVAVITPDASTLEAELFVPSRSAGFVREGQEVRLRFDAFPYQRFGSGTGRVVSVSRTLLAPTEISVPGVEIREPVFRARVRLDRSFVEAYGEAIDLQPGMLVSADIVLERRSLLQWVLDPVYAASRR